MSPREQLQAQRGQRTGQPTGRRDRLAGAESRFEVNGRGRGREGETEAGDLVHDDVPVPLVRLMPTRVGRREDVDDRVQIVGDSTYETVRRARSCVVETGQGIDEPLVDDDLELGPEVGVIGLAAWYAGHAMECDQDRHHVSTDEPIVSAELLRDRRDVGKRQESRILRP